MKENIWYKRGGKARIYDTKGQEDPYGPIEIYRTRKDYDGWYKVIIADFRAFEAPHEKSRPTTKTYLTKSLGLSAAYIEQYLANLRRESDSR